MHKPRNTKYLVDIAYRFPPFFLKYLIYVSNIYKRIYCTNLLLYVFINVYYVMFIDFALLEGWDGGLTLRTTFQYL